MMDSNRKIKIVVISGKEEMFFSNFQIIQSLSVVELVDGSLRTVLKDSKGWYVPSSGSSGNRYIKEMVQRGETVLYVS